MLNVTRAVVPCVGLTALEGGDRLVRAFEGAARGGVPVAG